MSVHTYILSKYITGSTRDDTQLDIHQVVENSRYEIDDPIGLMAGDVFSAIEQYVDPRYTKDELANLLRCGEKRTFSLKVFNVNPSCVVKKVSVTVDPENGLYQYDIRGGIRVRQVYEVRQIDDADVGYLVSEHILCPSPGIMLTERCYRAYFRDLQSAVRYRDAKMKAYKRDRGSPESGYRLTVVDVNELERSPWYNANLKAAQDIKNYQLDVEDYRYIGNMSVLLDTIRADAYDQLPEEEQGDVNYSIYMTMRQYISADYLMSMDDDVDTVGPGELEGIADMAIILALVGAGSQDALDNVAKELGSLDYRIGALTDNIYNAHPDEGYILVSSDGDMEWYNNIGYVNEWEGNAGNPWFGKFQPNENNTLLCFREYHPELIVKRLPKPSELRAYEAKYLATISEERARHDEMRFETFEDDYGQDVEVCVGDWYCEGVRSKKCYEGIHFAVDYGSHRFTYDECKQLLSGEEIVVEKFMTKIGRETTIRGKLKDCSTMYDDELNIQFTRTDISAKRRRMMAMDMGIDAEESGLPSEDDSGGI